MTRANALATAARYFMDDLPEVAIPATRLSNILDRLRTGQQLTTIALNHLQKQGFIALHRHAAGEITYQAFCEVARAEQDKRRQTAEVERLLIRLAPKSSVRPL